MVIPTKIFLHDNLSYKSFFTRKFPVYTGDVCHEFADELPTEFLLKSYVATPQKVCTIISKISHYSVLQFTRNITVRPEIFEGAKFLRLTGDPRKLNPQNKRPKHTFA